MKKITFIMFFSLLIASVAYADWIDNFISRYRSEGIIPAVTQALKEGNGPEAIINEGLKLQELNPQNLVMALYCGGVTGDDVRAAANNAGISDMLVVAAFEQSVVECGDQVADTQAYTPANTNNASSFAGIPAPGVSGGSSYASPSTF